MYTITNKTPFYIFIVKGLAVRERNYDVFGNKRIETDPDRRAHFKKTLTDELEKRGGFRRDWERYGRSGMTRKLLLTRRGGLNRDAEADDEMPVALTGEMEKRMKCSEN